MSDTFDHESDAALEYLDEYLKELYKARKAKARVMAHLVRARDKMAPHSPEREFAAGVIEYLKLL